MAWRFRVRIFFFFSFFSQEEKEEKEAKRERKAKVYEDSEISCFGAAADKRSAETASAGELPPENPFEKLYISFPCIFLLCAPCGHPGVKKIE
ncbi:MAG: hypothetical protein ACI4NL_01045 [Christensenellales bacterium]